MAYDRHESNHNTRYTGTMKWQDTEGIGYITCEEMDVLVTPLSISYDVIKEGDMVTFNIKIRDSNPRHEAIDVQRFGTECHKCSRSGHYFYDCPSHGSYDWVTCYKCGLVGHFAKGCDQKFHGLVAKDKLPSHERLALVEKTENRRETVKRSCYCRDGCWLSLFGGVCRNVLGSTANLVLPTATYDVNWPPLIEAPLRSSNDGDETEVLRTIICVKSREDVKKVEGVEDCFILEFDPNLESMDNLSLDGNSQDDMCVVAEKGKVACRDYAHSRHHCGNKPFQTTPHESHCEMCYCYICEVPAPCKKWTNASKDRSLNHCDASDEIDFWKAQKDLEKNRK